MSVKDNKLGLIAMVAMCLGPMIGSGLFALPQNVASEAGVVAAFIGWIVTFIGMFCLARVFQNLSLRRPDLDAGIYSYAKEGLGDFVGFSSAWGYWVSAWIANVGYLIMFCSALSIFFPVFGGGGSWHGLLLNSAIIWVVTYMSVRGIKGASIANTITTVAKVVPVVVFIVIAAIAFKPHVFVADIWQTANLGSVMGQVKNMMLITVWVFIGVEGANVFSSRARNRKDIGRATIISFLIMLVVLLSVSMLPFGSLSQGEISALHPATSTGGVLSHIVGRWGNIFMNVGQMIAIIGAFLAWLLIAAEVPFIAGKRDGLFPKMFTAENAAKCPVGSLLITSICQQAFLIVAYFYGAGYLETVLFAASMILPAYLFTAVYSLILIRSGRTYANSSKKEIRHDLLVGVIAVIYGIWLLYASWQYLLLSSGLYLLGGIVFIINRKNRKQNIFRKYEWVIFFVLGALSVLSIIAFVAGWIKLA